MSGQALMPHMMRSCPESHCQKDDAIRDSRIAPSPESEFLLCEAGVLGGDDGQQSSIVVKRGRAAVRCMRLVRRTCSVSQTESPAYAPASASILFPAFGLPLSGMIPWAD